MFQFLTFFLLSIKFPAQGRSLVSAPVRVPVHRERISQLVQSVAGVLISAVDDPAVSLYHYHFSGNTRFIYMYVHIYIIYI